MSIRMCRFIGPWWAIPNHAHRRFIGPTGLHSPPLVIPLFVILSAAKDLSRHAALPQHASTWTMNLQLPYEARQHQSAQSANPSILEGG